MKLLRNPVVVGILAVFAVVVVWINVISPMIKGPRRAPRPAPAAASAAATSAAKTAVASAADTLRKMLPPSMQPAPPPEPPVDVAALLPQAPHWLRTPRRDPFHSRYRSQSRAAQLLKLTGTWRQTGGGLATINNRVLAEGETILEFTVEKIEPDRVWVTGPEGREALLFNLPSGAEEVSPVNVVLEAEPGH